MNINKLVKIYFSPTHSTEKIINAIAKGWNIPNQKNISLNSLIERHNFNPDIQINEAILLGIPVYEERIPSLLYPALIKMKGLGQPIVLVVTYGNISAGIALQQLKKMMQFQGFKIIAAASFIGEHSFSYQDIKIADGRPDKKDLILAESFGKQIKEKIEQNEGMENINNLEIKGELLTFNRVLPKHSELLITHAPVIDKNICQKCKKCLAVCPMNAIDPISLKSREKLCIRCFACVKLCPFSARKISYKKMPLIKSALKIIGKKRKEPKIYL
ncbi:MAG: EFR1 family ferrodoxin [Atribacterota bacterium]|nr:EFR1 family ferrodoxin [Atribacterota bacterium]